MYLFLYFYLSFQKQSLSSLTALLFTGNWRPLSNIIHPTSHSAACAPQTSRAQTHQQRTAAPRDGDTHKALVGFVYSCSGCFHPPRIYRKVAAKLAVKLHQPGRSLTELEKMRARGQIELSAHIEAPWGNRNICSNMSFSSTPEADLRAQLPLKFKVNE